MENSVKILEEIKEDYLEKFENDPLIRRVLNTVISEFKERYKTLY